MMKTLNIIHEQLDFLKLSKKQMTVVKTTLRSVNSTLLTVSENERALSKGLEERRNMLTSRTEK